MNLNFPLERNPGKSHRNKIPRDENGVGELESEPRSKKLAEQELTKSNKKVMKKEQEKEEERGGRRNRRRRTTSSPSPNKDLNNFL